MTLLKSDPEARAITAERVMRRGRASIREVAVLLDICWQTAASRMQLGKIESYQLGARLYTTPEELVKHGAALPIRNIPPSIDSNDQDLGVDYD